MNEKDMLEIVGHKAMREFSVEWSRIMDDYPRYSDIDAQAVAYHMFAAGYLARVNDERENTFADQYKRYICAAE